MLQSHTVGVTLHICIIFHAFECLEFLPDMPKDELLMRANYEKEKGNESFKAGDFEEALLYYNRSLSISPTAAVFNNRAITSIKLQRYSEAIEDCNRVLEEESNNIKGMSLRV